MSTYPSLQQRHPKRSQYDTIDSLYGENRPTEYSDRTYSRAAQDLEKLIKHPKGRFEKNVLFDERVIFIRGYHILTNILYI